MNLTNNIFLTSLIICLTSYSTTTKEKDTGAHSSITTKQTADRFPKVDVVISLTDTVLNFGDNIFLNINLINKGNEAQKLLFDKPTISTGGFWAATGKVTDAKTRKSALKYENKAMLSSQLHTEDQLKDKYYYLEPGQTIQGQYELSDIVVFNSSDNLLPKGTYEVQLFYYSNPSNVVTVKIE